MKRLPSPLRTVSPAELAERLSAERRGVPLVLYVDGDGRQRIVELDGRASRLSIGRDGDSDIPLVWDGEVSRAHALLELVGSAWTIVDEGLSRNGSFVNGERVRARKRLADGDVMTLGSTTLAFVAAHAALPTTAMTRHREPPELSPAQRRVLHALCAPTLDDPFAPPPSNRELSAELFLSVETVKTHLHALFEAFGIGQMPQNRKRAELVRRAFERGALL